MKSAVSSRFKQLPRDSFLAQFLSQHDDPLRGGFITRLDRSPIATKRLAFMKAFLMNIFFLLSICALACVTIIRDLWSPLPISSKLAICISQDILIGSAIFVLVRSTTIPFFFGECRLRILYGFRASEIVIRKPPKMPLVLNNNTTEDQRMERYWRIATRAVNPELLYSNASAMLSSEYWTLEYRAVFDAIRRIAAGEFGEEALEFAIWKQDNEIWSVCELWRMHEIMSDQQEVSMFKVCVVTVAIISICFPTDILVRTGLPYSIREAGITSDLARYVVTHPFRQNYRAFAVTEGISSYGG
ncbi:hypothetical protein GALMADRAFT_60448 [Galerina marginata CBS 339.88]|uniref:Uncharacterized protein n=1 Tax=Galerina marginata (strain CBS 339.88) TaxID=685588 RepID=A0A067TNJ0_GALM3|nr:hypothetical protein GALMADRAFT_60448 [Galerina marginata CBS 339.88]